MALEVGEVFYEGSSAAILPELVPQEKIKDAVFVSKVDDGIVVVVSPMAAALIYNAMPLADAFAEVALLNFAAFVLQRCIRPQYETVKNPEGGKPFVWSDFLQGVRYVKRDQFLSVFITVLPVVNVFLS